MNALAVAAIIGTVPAWAQGGGTPKIDCKKATSTPEMNYCAEQDYDRADARLNAAYRAMLARVDANDGYDAKTKASFKAAVQDAQRKWIAFRDADCNEVVAIAWNGGTGTTSAVLACMTDKALARTKVLESLPQN